MHERAESSPEAWYSEWLRAAVVAIPLFFGGDAQASGAQRRLQELSQVPASCTALISHGGSVHACRVDLVRRANEITQFAQSPEIHGLTLFSSATHGKERCKAALEILEAEKEKMRDIVRFLGGEIKEDGSDVVSTMLLSDTVRTLTKQKGAAPTREEFVAYVDQETQQNIAALQQCGLILRGAMALGLGKMTTSIQQRAKPLMDIITEGMSPESRPERRRDAALAMFQLLSILERVAKEGAR